MKKSNTSTNILWGIASIIALLVLIMAIQEAGFPQQVSFFYSLSCLCVGIIGSVRGSVSFGDGVLLSVFFSPITSIVIVMLKDGDREKEYKEKLIELLSSQVEIMKKISPENID